MKIESCFKGRNCFLKGCKWSPDGFCLLSNSEDNVLRLFEIAESVTKVASEEVLPVVIAKEGGTIYDFEWYSKMNSSDPITCVFASTSQNSPIHLWDAYTGCLRATYQPINQYDEVTAAYSLAFSPDGRKIYSGFKKVIRIFDVSLPGRVSEERNVKPKGESVFQTSIISCISINPVAPNIYALGSYDRTIGIYTEPKGELQCLMKGHTGGITEMKFSSDGVQLYSGGRKDSEIICWDLRNPGRIMCIMKREVNTNQRIYFDLANEKPHLVTGSTDGRIIIYDTTVLTEDKETILEPVIAWKGHDDCVNGVSFHPFWPILASSSGQYHQPESETDDGESTPESKVENSVKLWSIHLND
ncbi:UNVERIFIED_CONTAM: hypothetical protein PYX00_002490 [Menopon gallinae]|uniref:WD repeat-containing protein 79 n=1 Tax=Menopon gallinae TaxID=328185 RepID=A0AAW2IGQ9_9NEOP